MLGVLGRAKGWSCGVWTPGFEDKPWTMAFSPGSQKVRQAEAAVVLFADAAGKAYASL